MIYWSGNIPNDGCGRKAKSLDDLQGVNVPNFFAVDKETVANNIERRGSSISINQSLLEEIKEAYNDVGISSEVRNAAPEAKSLVGNQRSKRRVSVRASSKGHSKFKLNVGSSNLKNAVEQVIESFYKNNREVPALIVQKMVEPDVTGAVVYRYGSSENLVEAIRGNGRPLEDGTTKPAYWIVSNQKIRRSWEPNQQTVSEKEVMGSGHTRSTQKLENSLLDKEKIKELVETAKRNKKGLKFVVKRNTIYIVGTVEEKPEFRLKKGKKLLLSEGSEQNFSSENTIDDLTHFDEKNSAITRRGGFTSTAAQLARKKSIRLVYNPEASQGSKEKNDNPFSAASGTSKTSQEKRSKESKPFENLVTAVDVVEINEDSGLRLRPPYSNAKYTVGDGSGGDRNYSSSRYVTELEEILNSEDPVIIDFRKMKLENPLDILKKVECDIEGIITNRANREELKVALNNLIEFLAVEEEVNKTREEMARIERRRILRGIRDSEL